MKTNKLFQFLTMFICAFAFAFVTGCEGPVGPPGADGTNGIDGTDGQDGVDGNVTCLECHNQANMDSKVAQFARSSHSGGEVDEGREAWSSSCVRCHTDQGFVEYTEGVSIGGLTGGSNEFVCATCHSIHQTFEAADFALRKSDAVTFIFDNTTTFDAGNSNLCVNCHQSRRAGPTDMGGQFVDLNGIDDDGPGGVGDDDEFEVPAGEFFISSTHYGPHHGPQGNLLAGVGFAEIAGSMAYPADYSATHYSSDDGRCTGCHMAVGADDGEGGHTYMPTIEACTGCHAGATDFDINDVRSDNQDLLDEIRDKLLAAGVLEFDDGEYYDVNPETGVIELVEGTAEYHPHVGVYPKEEAEAFFNWIGIVEDRSLGVHNPAYVKALLTNTLEALN